MTFDLLLKDGVVLLPDPQDPLRIREEKIDIGISKGYIQKIGQLNPKQSSKSISLKGLHILPGLIDSQVHFREPGMEHKEDIAHGSLSAVKGGITAFFEMPNTSPPTIRKPDLEAKISIAQEKSWCDYAFYLGASPDNLSELKDIEFSKGCCGIKVFLGKSTGNLVLEEESKLELLLSQGSRRISFHSEDEKRLTERKAFAKERPHTHPVWRDVQTALISTKRICALAQKHNRPIHILHVTTREEIAFLKDQKKLVSVEVTPQHLSLHAPDCYDELGTLAQMNPPIRSKEHQDALWKGIHANVVDVLGSDHAPHTREEKSKTYPLSPSGMPGTQTLLPLMLNHIHEGRLDLKTLVKLLAHNPARLFKLKKQGFIKEGYKAHFTVVDLKSKKRIESSWLASKCQWSPFEGKRVMGWPVATFLHGQAVMREDEVLGHPSGQEIEFDFHSHF